MKRIFTEKTMVVLLFLVVIITFSLAQHDTRHLESIPTANDPVAERAADLMYSHQFQLKSGTSISGIQ